ncbi:hypothetical protein BpHYR1_051887 [Brachionus plicatilis]|uniref:Uncharacterized protein n=1 Tax=Brachionus plicatilis TaxID=10195 RepID=A0A3M7RLM0_BRAPC|nr:hypothetical protein BpHYR1_051887 [Brachionus plicatilis]
MRMNDGRTINKTPVMVKIRANMWDIVSFSFKKNLDKTAVMITAELLRVSISPMSKYLTEKKPRIMVAEPAAPLTNKSFRCDFGPNVGW